MWKQLILDFSKVFIAYYLIIIFFPSLIIRPLIKKKNIVERSITALVFGNFFIINLTFFLAYLNIFNKILLIVFYIFFGVLIRWLIDKKSIKIAVMKIKNIILHILSGELGFKTLFIKNKLVFLNKCHRLKEELFEGKKYEWIILILILLFNLYIYNTNNVKFLSFSAPDEEVHLYWIQSLIKGNIFPSGVYPHGFHNIVGSIAVMFNLKAAAVLSVFSAVATTFIMLMLYLGVRKLFRYKYSALVGFTVFSICNLFVVEAVYRYQFAVPQEYAMIFLMPLAIYLFNYLENKKADDLILAGMCFVLTISIHFYVTIIALVLCLAIGLIYLTIIFKKKVFLRLIACVVISTIVAILPLSIAVIQGHPLEQSMNWAVSVVKGNEFKNDSEAEKKDNAKENLKDVEEKLSFQTFYEDTYHEISKYVLVYPRGIYIFITLILLSLILNIICLKYNSRDKESRYQLAFTIYIALLTILLLSRALKIPALMEPKRVAIFWVYATPVLFGMPIESIFQLIRNSKKGLKAYIRVTKVLLVVFIIGVFKGGFYRDSLQFYYFQTNGTRLAIDKIIDTYKDYTWTIISSVNENCLVQNNGYHYELDNFIIDQEGWNSNKEIYIPTKYVFLIVEKKPIILYGNRFYENDDAIINRSSITYEDACKELSEKNENNTIYRKQRPILMAKAYYWAQEYMKYFPDEMNVYYEDEETVVYRIVQNEYFLNNLAINYGVNIVD